MAVYLRALALRNYRGIGDEFQKLPKFKDFNFFIGPNNSGKSTVLNFISRWLPLRVTDEGGRAYVLDALEVHNHGIAGTAEGALGFTVEEFASVGALQIGDETARSHFRPLIEKLAKVLSDGSHVWLKFPLPFGNVFTYLTPPNTQVLLGLFDQNDWHRLFSALTGGGGGSPDVWIERVVELLLRQQTGLPQTLLIPAIRQIGPHGEAFEGFSGRGLIDRLAEMQSPDIGKRQEREVFDRINAFLQTVTGHEGARIEIPHNRAHVLVHMNKRVLPLSSLGTGIEEVIMIAAFCTINDERIICIEEPEIHLHPLLQRKLVAYLSANTSNQYFIATHSASFIDTPGAAIFHVTLQNDATVIRESELRRERHAICVDLGYRASDIVQANSVIWVEGPSDRLYLKGWLSEVAPELQEGIHYSIMFYGGRLLSHLSADDDEITDFISLRALNQNVAVIMDSDRKHSRDGINATKTRIEAEFSGGRGIAWITKGREIENYVDHAVLQSAVKEAHASIYKSPLAGGPYDHALYFERSKPKQKGASTEGGAPQDTTFTDVDKVKVARIVCGQPVRLDILDLRERVEEIVGMIRRANH